MLVRILKGMQWLDDEQIKIQTLRNIRSHDPSKKKIHKEAKNAMLHILATR